MVGHLLAVWADRRTSTSCWTDTRRGPTVQSRPAEQNLRRLGPGDEGPNTGVGPAFKYEDVNVFDLKLTGERIPTTVGAGDRFRFAAEVGEFNTDQCLFFLKPVSTETR
ncbi:DUF4839 domain-containing protein [Streptomyces goshikiensis]|uniref:DUF4839 domain-containing protein n=1 Tax=Streptomyces goshikiensis TaxID=1942 RepID=UPI00368A21C5